MGNTSQGGRGETAYLALGSNLGDRLAFLEAAARGLAACDVRLQACSAIYETDAVADEPQPPYLNAVLRVRTDLDPEELLRTALRVEASLGRERPAGRRRAPRTVDIDLLLYGQAVLDVPGLRLPHPELLARSFVRVPLRDVAAPGLCHPLTGERLDLIEGEANDDTKNDTKNGPGGVRLWQRARTIADLVLPAPTAGG